MNFAKACEKDFFISGDCLGHLLVLPVYTQSPVLARLLLALVSVDFASVSLETGQAGAREAAGVLMATAAIETWL